MRVLVLSLLLSTTAHAQTVLEVSDARRACFTGDVVGLSAQLSEFHRICLRPGEFVRIDHPNITLNNPDRTHPYMQATARDALHEAADVSPRMMVSSVFRTVADQYVLWASVGFMGGCTAAAEPGSSRHQSGRAIDFSNWEELRPHLEAAGCSWLGAVVPEDPFHFDCPGENRGEDAVLAFQTLWNVNNPDDTIAEDGVYGPQTRMRLEMSPASGFEISGCDMPDPDAGVIDGGSMDAGAIDASVFPDGGMLDAGVDGSVRVDRLSNGCGCHVIGARSTATDLSSASVFMLAIVLGARRTRRKLNA